MRRVLMVSPHFPPVNAADHQRVRMSLPYLREFGWEATVLAVKPEAVEGAVLDPLLEKTIPAETEVVRVSALPSKLTRGVGLGNLAMRALPYLWREGNRLLRKSQRSESRKVDLLFFSTTQFPVMILGPIWKRRFGVPYVVDFQDPWLDDYYERTGTAPPGGKAKYGLSRRLARILEPRVMGDVSQIIAVSPFYVRRLKERYPHLPPDAFTVLPFGGAEQDFELLDAVRVEQPAFDRNDGRQHWVYVGRGGSDIAGPLRLLFGALCRLREESSAPWKNVRMHFIGTSYAPAGRAQKTVEPIAVECGVGDMVEEITDRLPYFQALKVLTEADVLLVVGSDSPGYSASKLYPYMLARKPMLAVLHAESPGVDILRQCRAGEVVTFKPGDVSRSHSDMARALQRTYDMARRHLAPSMEEEELAKYSAREMTRIQCEVFDRAIAAIASR